MAAESMVILEPVADDFGNKKTLARRPENLGGKVVGLLDNNGPNGRKLLDRVAELLQSRYQLAGLIHFNLATRKMEGHIGDKSLRPAPATIEEITPQIDAAVTAIAH